MPLTTKQLAWLRSVKALADRVCPEFGVPPQVAVAQAVLETGWGKSRPGNNLFGVRGKGDAGSTSITTTEVINGQRVVLHGQGFAAYSSEEASCRAYCELLSTARYVGARAYLPDLARYVTHVWGSGYATALKYVETVCSIIRTAGSATGDDTYTATVDRGLSQVLDALKACNTLAQRRTVLAREAKTGLRKAVAP